MPPVKNKTKAKALPPIATLRPSGLGDFLICPHAYYLKYILKVPTAKRGWARPEGTSIHAAMQAHNKHVAATGTPASLVPLMDVFLTTFKKESKEYTPHEDDDKEKVIRTRAAAFIQEYLQDHAAGLVPVSADHIEKEYKGSIGGCLITGHVDLVTKDSSVGERVLDYKTGKQAKSLRELENDLQQGAYALLTGIPHLRFVSFVKLKVPKVVTVEVTRTQESLDKTERVVESIVKTIQTGVFHKADPTHWKCSRKWCDVWESCVQGGGTK